MIYIILSISLITILFYLFTSIITPIYDELVIDLQKVSKILNNPTLDNGSKVNKIITNLSKPLKIRLGGAASKFNLTVNSITLFPEYKEMLKLLNEDLDLFAKAWHNEYGLYSKVQNNTITFYNKYGVRSQKREYKRNLFLYFGIPTSYTQTVYYTNNSTFLFPDENCGECCKVKLRDTLGIWGKLKLIDVPPNFYLGCDKCQSKQKIKLIYTKKNNCLNGYFKEYYESSRKNRNHGTLRTKKTLINGKKFGKCSMYYQNGTEALSISFLNNKLIGPEEVSKSTAAKIYEKFKNNGEIEFKIYVFNSGILTLESKCFCGCNVEVKNCQKVEKKFRSHIPSRDTLENDIFVKELLLNDWNENQKTEYYRK